MKMLLIKKKSLIVSLVSSLVIAIVLILTLISYILYLEMKSRESSIAYEVSMHKLNARIYGKFVDKRDVNVRMGKKGSMEGQPIIEGRIRNNGTRGITDILAKVKFKDRDGALMYEVTFHPQEPVFGSDILTRIPIPYISIPATVEIPAGKELVFKRMLPDCPAGIISTLREVESASTGDDRRWPGILELEIVSLGLDQ
jgi:hypothetical protein